MRHQLQCFPPPEDADFGGDGGFDPFDSPCKNAEIGSHTELDLTLSPGKQKSGQQIADEVNAGKSNKPVSALSGFVGPFENENSVLTSFKMLVFAEPIRLTLFALMICQGISF